MMSTIREKRMKKFGKFLTVCIDKYKQKHKISQQQLVTKLKGIIHKNKLSDIKFGRASMTPEQGLELVEILQLDANEEAEFLMLFRWNWVLTDLVS